MGGRVRALGALMLALALTLSGCGVTTLNATGYVSGLMDSTYRGSYSSAWLKLVDLTTEEAVQDRHEGLYAEYKRFTDRFGIRRTGVSKATRDEIISYLGKLYTNAKYHVDYATRSESGAWLVEVTVQPITTLATLLDSGKVEQLQAMFDAEQSVEDIERDNLWAAMVLELCEGSETTYGEAVTIAVRLVGDKDGKYSIAPQDFYNLDALVLTYEN